MCGISGFINLSNSVLAKPELIVAMNDEMALRGPDGEGFLFSGNNYSDFAIDLKQKRNQAVVLKIESDRNFVFGHRRLSIIDLSADASQPMTEISQNYWITFNGEIYNHAEIRTELESLGYQFKTHHSDTEVILVAYAAWGKNCLQKLRGMFAFVIFDKINNSFFAVRDRLGVKPFYYMVHKGIFYFSSEFKAILTNKAIPREINFTALSDYLSFTSIPAPKTIFKGIKKLPAAHYIYIKGEQVQTPTRYWNPLSNKIINKPENIIIDELLHHVETSVKYRTIADVPIGCLLSGGVDSSTNLAFMSQAASEPVNAFTVGFANRDGYENEFIYAQKAAKLFNANYYELKLDESHFLNFIEDIINIQDEPTADTASIPIYYIAKKAKELGISVLLGGEGSDELLLGYELWRLMEDFKTLFKNSASSVSIPLFKILHSMPVLKNKRLFYKKWVKRIENNDPLFIGGTELRDEEQKSGIISENFKSLLDGYSSYEVVNQYYYKYIQLSQEERSYYDFMSFLDLNFRLPESLLARLDKMTMAASVEAREPFMDHVLTEFCLSIPADLKVKNNLDKYLLKKGMEKILPKEILYRPKQGFTVPLNNLLFEEKWGNKIANDFNEFNSKINLFDKKYLETIMSTKNGTEVWNILNITTWLKNKL